MSVMFFIFQAEDGIRDYKVTGVQTCALPISGRSVPYSLCLERRSPSPSSRLISRTRAALEHSVGELVHSRLYCEYLVFVIKAAPSLCRKARQEEQTFPPFPPRDPLLVNRPPSHVPILRAGPCRILPPTGDINRATSAITCSPVRGHFSSSFVQPFAAHSRRSVRLAAAAAFSKSYRIVFAVASSRSLAVSTAASLVACAACARPRAPSPFPLLPLPLLRPLTHTGPPRTSCYSERPRRRRWMDLTVTMRL